MGGQRCELRAGLVGRPFGNGKFEVRGLGRGRIDGTQQAQPLRLRLCDWIKRQGAVLRYAADDLEKNPVSYNIESPTSWSEIHEFTRGEAADAPCELQMRVP